MRGRDPAIAVRCARGQTLPRIRFAAERAMPCARSPPLDGSEPVVTEVRVEDADRPASLSNVAESGEARVAARPDVAHRERMLAIDPERERGVRAHDVVVPAGAGR